MNIARLAIKTLAWRARSFEASTKRALKSQEKILFEFLRRNKNTEFGRKYNFSSIRTIKEYQESVPLSDCESLRGLISRMTRGENNILTVDKPIFFGVTSGTTNKPKLIPVTGYSRNKKSDLMNLWTYYIVRDHPKVLDGKILAIISPEKEDMTESGLLVGAESGHAYKNMPMAVRGLYALPYQVFDIDDFETRYYCILRIGMEKNISTIATLNPSTLIILCQKIDVWQDDIIEDIERGALSKKLNIPSDVRKSIERTLAPNSKRALALRQILREKGKLIPEYFWPGLEIIECWKGGTVKLYLKELTQYFGRTAIRDMGCLSTEARSSIPTSDEGAGGILAINTNFYEFIRKEDIEKADKLTCLCTELEKGREYYMVVTTPGGLYRYNTDDIIVVDDFFNSTPVIEFLQKGRNASSLAGEKLYESQVNEAISRIAEKYSLAIRLFSAVADSGMPPHYVFLVEFKKGFAPSVSGRELLEAMDGELRKENREYDYVRQAELLHSPTMKVITGGGFEKYRAMKIRSGTHDSQFKAPELTTDMTFQKNFEIEEEISME